MRRRLTHTDMPVHASSASPSLSFGAKYSPPHSEIPADVVIMLTVSNRPAAFFNFAQPFVVKNIIEVFI